MNKSGCTTIENVDDSEDYDRFKSSMQTLGFSGDEQETIFASLAAVLHLGNVNFKKNEGKGEGSVVANNEGNNTDIVYYLTNMKCSCD